MSSVWDSCMLPCFILQVSKLAGVLVKNGVRQGDLVVIYMPMVPEAMIAMLACARIGAPHSLIFGGFASKELSVRIDHAKVRIIFFWNYETIPNLTLCKPLLLYMMEAFLRHLTH